ncbi:MAG: YaaL family protein [Eubacterium sp.]|nr:YaaL family protein [Eubacterium sp.]
MIFLNKKSTQQKQKSKDIAELKELKEQIEISKMAISSAQNQFEHVVDPTLIDCYIYELNAAQLRYQFLLKNLKSRELQKS